MKFDLKIWKKYYDESHQISQLLKMVTANRKACRSNDDYNYLINQSKTIAKSISKYLDACNLTMPVPLWHYNIEDTRTHFSHDDFKYHNRIKLGSWDVL